MFDNSKSPLNFELPEGEGEYLKHSEGRYDGVEYLILVNIKGIRLGVMMLGASNAGMIFMLQRKEE